MMERREQLSHVVGYAAYKGPSGWVHRKWGGTGARTGAFTAPSEALPAAAMPKALGRGRRRTDGASAQDAGRPVLKAPKPPPEASLKAAPKPATECAARHGQSPYSVKAQDLSNNCSAARAGDVRMEGSAQLHAVLTDPLSTISQTCFNDWPHLTSNCRSAFMRQNAPEILTLLTFNVVRVGPSGQRV